MVPKEDEEEVQDKEAKEENHVSLLCSTKQVLLMTNPQRSNEGNTDQIHSSIHHEDDICQLPFWLV